MSQISQLQQAPELAVSQWFNTDTPITLADLRGKVVVIETFQMLCPGCVSHSLPQARQIFEIFPKDKVAVLGLHTVFEHHEAMTPVSLKAFIHEYGLSFPIGVDQPGKGAVPKTMEAYGLRGTPSLLIIDQQGLIRINHFGNVTDMQLAYQIAELVHANEPSQIGDSERLAASGCDEEGCTVS